MNFDDTEFVEWKNQAVGSKSDQVSLDEVCKDLPRPILIKVDVDGFELDVLESGRSTLEEGDCCLILETHSQELESSCLDLLKSLGKSVKIIPNGRMRFLVPERRPIPHNRWAYAK